MSDLLKYFENNRGRLIHKWHHYFGIYERHLNGYRNRPIRVLEFGVSHGGSLQMWKHYFGPQAKIVGVDIDPRCAAFAEDNVDVVIGDQEDRGLHAKLRAKYGDFDIIIDDGGHTMQQQIVTFEELYPSLKIGGVYIAEDLHTSYMPDWKGGLRQAGSFIEFAKQLIDQQNASWVSANDLKVNHITQTAYGIHFYDSVLVIEKQQIQPLTQFATGTPSFPAEMLTLGMLAYHDMTHGRKQEALEKCKQALAAHNSTPDLVAKITQIKATLEAELNAPAPS